MLALHYQIWFNYIRIGAYVSPINRLIHYDSGGLRGIENLKPPSSTISGNPIVLL